MITAPEVSAYLASLRSVPHPVLDDVWAAGQRQGLPIVDPQTGSLLHVLTRLLGARRVLEIGTAIGYSTLWMATALPADGQVITLERNVERAQQARQFFAAAGVADRISVMIGDASRYLHKVSGPFDLIFQDADKAQYGPMLDRLLDLLRPGGLLVTDNALWSGAVVPGLGPAEPDADTRAIADYNQRLAADPRVTTAFFAVGDGVAVAIKQPHTANAV